MLTKYYTSIIDHEIKLIKEFFEFLLKTKNFLSQIHDIAFSCIFSAIINFFLHLQFTWNEFRSMEYALHGNKKAG